MRFVVSRTSQWRGEEPPCPEAFKAKIAIWEYREFRSPEEYDKQLPHKDRWTDQGTEHGYWHDGENRGIKRRRLDREAWFIEIATLDELLAFGHKYGDLVLTIAHQDRQTPEIEIYDYYRE